MSRAPTGRRMRTAVDTRSPARNMAPVTPRKPTGAKPKYPPQKLGPRDQLIGVRRGNLHDALLERERVGVKPVDIIRRDLLRFYAAADDSVKRCGLTAAELRRIGAMLDGAELEDPRQALSVWAILAGELGEQHAIPTKLKGQPIAVLYGVLDAADRAHHAKEGRDG